MQGSIYIAKPTCNPCTETDATNGTLYGIYVEAAAPTAGVIVKLHGEVSADPKTGRLTARFRNNPQFPFEELKLKFEGGSLAPLANPQTCGSFRTESDFTPWSTPETKDATPIDSFTINQGANGTACVGSESQEPSAVSVEAGSQSPLAGAYSPFVFKLSREDGTQRLDRVDVTLPPGLLGKLAGVGRCSDAQIAAAAASTGRAEVVSPSCPSASRVGSVTVGAGPGSKPFYVHGGVYLAGPYGGAPFSLVFVTPAVAGPFDLGDVVVRAGLFVDRNTARVSVRSDAIPTILDGTPLDVRSITVVTDRSDFMLNPTSCEPMSVNGQAVSTFGQTTGLSEHYQVAGCAALAFKPVFKVSTLARASANGNGAGLTVEVASRSGEANLHNVEARLPKLLPSRLTTLQKACVARVFETNPASCPVESNVGTAVAKTPILDRPLTGPAYLVSHGGAGFPDLEVVLQGEGIVLVLDGKTEIKNGVTISRFQTVPDAPVSSFKLELPEGPHALLAVPRGVSLCDQPLWMPTRMVAQNGALIEQSTQIQVVGCPYSLNVLSHTSKNHALTVKVVVPQAGKLTATAVGLTNASKSPARRQTVTLKLNERQAGPLSTKIQLRFTPSKGKQRRILHKTITVSLH